MKILIADDEAVSRHLLEKTLTPASYEVIAVENGVLAAEQLCRPESPRLALLDWVMPELLGPDVCRHVRQRRDQPYVYMVLLTSKESKQDVVAGLESGADDYLIKPFDPDELEARLRTGARVVLWHNRPSSPFERRCSNLSRLRHAVRFPPNARRPVSIS